MNIYPFFLILYLLANILYCIVPLALGYLINLVNEQHLMLHIYHVPNQITKDMIFSIVLVIFSTIIGLTLSKMFIFRVKDFRKIAITKRFFQFILLLLVLLILIIVYINRDLLSSYYIRSLILQHNGLFLDKLDFLYFYFYSFLIFRFTYISDKDRRIDSLDKIVIILFILISILLRQRFQIAICVITIFLVKNKYSNFKLKNMLKWLVLLIFSFVVIVYFREMIYYSKNKLNYIAAFIIPFTEFYYAAISLINSFLIGYLKINPVVDSIIYLVPRFLLPEKDLLLSTTILISKFGGREVFSPYGGFPTIAQMYLFLGFPGIAMYFFFFTIILKIHVDLYEKTNSFWYAVSLFFMSFILVSSIRTPLYISISLYLKFLFLNFTFYSSLYILKHILIEK